MNIAKATGSRFTVSDLAGASPKDKKVIEAGKRLRDAHDAEFVLCGRDFWYWAENVITEDEDQKKQRPFPLDYPYLHDLYADYQNHRKNVMLKSRRLLASWLGMLIMLHNAMFANKGIPGCPEVFLGGVMSIGETEAAYLIQRIKRVYGRLPDWMKHRNKLLKDHMLYMEFEGGGTIRAFALKREGPQTFGFSFVFFDEMALQESVRTVWTGMMPTLGAEGRLMAVSTPNGKGNLFHDIWSNKDDQYQGINRITLHWRDNPEHDDAWFKATTAGMDKQMIARMFELSFASYLGQPVWSEFDRAVHVWDIDENPMVIDEDKPVYIGWDLGYHFPAATIWQRNSRDQWLGFMEHQGYDIAFDVFCEQVRDKLNTLYTRSKVREIHCLPPDAINRYNQRTKSGAVNDVGQIKLTFKVRNEPVQTRFCPGEVGTRDNEAPRLKETRKLWRLRADGQPGILLNPSMDLFIEGCLGGYCYPEKGNTEQPDKTEHSHLQDSGQSVFAAYARMAHGAQPVPSQTRERRLIGCGTGM